MIKGDEMRAFKGILLLVLLMFMTSVYAQDNQSLIIYGKEGFLKAIKTSDIDSMVIKDNANLPMSDYLTFEPKGWDEVKTFFKDELTETAHRIEELRTDSSLVLNIVTDSHENRSNAANVRRTEDTFLNVWALNQLTHCDGFVHLGDYLWSNSSSLYPNTDSVNAHLSVFRERMLYANPFSYMLLGNHDGLNGSLPQYETAYTEVGNYNYRYVCRPDNKPYFYFDNPHAKVRCVCLSIPFKEDSGNPWGWSPLQLKWLVNEALRVKDGWNIIIFSHVKLYSTEAGSGGLRNYKTLEGLINAFNTHEQYEDEVISADFSSYSHSRIMVWISGHSHYEWIITDSSQLEEFNLSCPIVICGSNQMYTVSKCPDTAVISTRKDKSVTQDLWDTFVYNRGEGKVHFVRFGAGEDRVVNVEEGM